MVLFKFESRKWGCEVLTRLNETFLWIVKGFDSRY